MWFRSFRVLDSEHYKFLSCNGFWDVVSNLSKDSPSLCLFPAVPPPTQIKKKTNFPHIHVRKFRWEVIYKREGFPYIWGNAQIFSSYMRSSLVKYDPVPLNFLILYMRKIFFSFFISASPHLNVKTSQTSYFRTHERPINALQFFALGLGKGWPLFRLTRYTLFF